MFWRKKTPTVSATALLRNEAERVQNIPTSAKGSETMTAVSWAYMLAAAFLEAKRDHNVIRRYKDVEDSSPKK